MRLLKAIVVFVLLGVGLSAAVLKLEKINPKKLRTSDAKWLNAELEQFKINLNQKYFKASNKSFSKLYKVYPWFSQDSYEELKKQVDLYGLEPFTISGQNIVLHPDKRLPKLIANFSRIDEGLFIINGYKVPKPKTWSEHRSLERKIRQIINSRGIEFFKSADAFINCDETQVKRSMATLSIAGDVLSVCTGSALASAGLALAKGIYHGCKNKSFKEGFNKTTDHLPVVGPAKELHKSYCQEGADSCVDAAK